MGDIEFGCCEVCGKETVLERTLFIYDVRCDCCGCVREGRPCHFEIVRHCSDCPAPMPVKISPLIKAMDGKSRKAIITNILPLLVEGSFIIDDAVISE